MAFVYTFVRPAYIIFKCKLSSACIVTEFGNKIYNKNVRSAYFYLTLYSKIIILTYFIFIWPIAGIKGSNMCQCSTHIKVEGIISLFSLLEFLFEGIE